MPYVDITYDLVDSDSATLSVTVKISTNGGAVYFAPSGISSDVGDSVVNGVAKKVVWNVGTDLPARLFNNVHARVTAQDFSAIICVAGDTSGRYAPGPKDGKVHFVHNDY